jgi:thiol-disulfide isomerase/thioredoxin
VSPSRRLPFGPGAPGRWLLWVASALLLVAAAFRVVRLHSGATPERVDLRSVTLEELDGQPVPLASLSGKALIVNFWAPWCPPCRLEIPWLQHLQDSSAGRLLVLGVVADPGQYDRARAFMQARGVRYLLLRDSPSLEGAFGGISALPASFYVAPSGIVVHASRGLIPEPLMAYYARRARNQK